MDNVMNFQDKYTNMKINIASIAFDRTILYSHWTTLYERLLYVQNVLSSVLNCTEKLDLILQRLCVAARYI